MHMAMVWTTLCTYLATHHSISRYVASLLAPKFRSSRREQITALIARSSSFACPNNGFRSSAQWPRSWGLWPCGGAGIPTMAFARCRDSSSNSEVHTIVICKGSNIKAPATRSTSQKYQSIVTQNIQQKIPTKIPTQKITKKFPHIGKWSRTPKYYTTQPVAKLV